MRSKILAALRHLVQPGDTVTAALSGGADSVAMTHCLASLQKDAGITVKACHYNHHLRGEESDGDEAFCHQFCDTLGIALAVGHGDVTGRMAQTGESLEEAARNLRYAFFASRQGFVATAHTADDNAETVLLNLIRGTALKGLCGIPEKRDAMIRPMLDVSREEVLTYLKEQNLPHRDDSTNVEDSHLRNRLRHHILPPMQQENPALLTAIRRMTENLRQDEAILQQQADALLQTDSVAQLKQAPQALRRRAVRSLLKDVSKLTSAHICAVEALILGDDPSARVCLPQNMTARREYDRLLLETGGGVPTFQPVTLPCPGSVTIEELGLCFRSEENGPSITIRPRKTGDTIRLPGGTKTVKKLLIDRKIPAQQRECIPILEREGAVLSVWGIAGDVPGVKADYIQRGDR